MIPETSPLGGTVVRPARFERPYRHLTTRELLAAKEITAWDRADLAADPTG